MAYGWPGNARELKSALEYAFVIAESGQIAVEHLPPALSDAAGPDRGPAPDRGQSDPGGQTPGDQSGGGVEPHAHVRDRSQ